jgi:hypothetical protein
LFADGTAIACYGNAKPTDTQLASTIHCVDDEIIGWLKRRERRSKNKSCLKAAPNSNPMIAKSGQSAASASTSDDKP